MAQYKIAFSNCSALRNTGVSSLKGMLFLKCIFFLCIKCGALCKSLVNEIVRRSQEDQIIHITWQNKSQKWQALLILFTRKVKLKHCLPCGRSSLASCPADSKGTLQNKDKEQQTDKGLSIWLQIYWQVIKCPYMYSISAFIGFTEGQI